MTEPNEDAIIKKEQVWLIIAQVTVAICRLILVTILVIGLIMGYKLCVLVSILCLLITWIRPILSRIVMR